MSTKSGILSAAILAGGFLAGCRIESLTPTAPLTPTPVPTAELPLALLLPTLGGAATQTPAPTATLTPEATVPEGAGERIFYDPLDDDRFGWTPAKTAEGSAAFQNGMFVFTVQSPNSLLTSTLSKDIPADAYIEVTVRTIICGAGVDIFGIIFRNQGEHSYRYAITCRGQLRLERYTGGGLDGASDWQSTLGLLQGAPASNRIGVLLEGSIFHFYVNGAEAFSRRDPVSASGGVGLFARSEKSQLLSVGFDDLSVYALSPAKP